MKYQGTFYRSRWDSSTWLFFTLTAVISISCCALPLLLDMEEGFIPLAICLVILIFIIVILKSVYYRIDGNNLIVFSFFIPKAYPIEKIEEISATKTWLSAPATSLTHRIAIKFSDKKILKSSMPLVISPVRQSEFINQLLRINPNIKVKK